MEGDGRGDVMEFQTGWTGKSGCVMKQSTVGIKSVGEEHMA